MFCNRDLTELIRYQSERLWLGNFDQAYFLLSPRLIKGNSKSTIRLQFYENYDEVRPDDLRVCVGRKLIMRFSLALHFVALSKNLPWRV